MTNNELALMANIAVDMQNNEINKVLEDIKAEIEQAKYWEYGQLVGTPNYLADGLEMALKIIDKHIGGKE